MFLTLNFFSFGKLNDDNCIMNIPTCNEIVQVIHIASKKGTLNLMT